jgi:hypothetical protein
VCSCKAILGTDLQTSSFWNFSAAKPSAPETSTPTIAAAATAQVIITTVTEVFL